MRWISSIVDGLKVVRDIVFGVRDARRANVNDALQGYAAGRSAHDAATNAGKYQCKWCGLVSTQKFKKCPSLNCPSHIP